MPARSPACAHVELVRFEKAADPWSAALAEARRAALRAASGSPLKLDAIAGTLVAEGSGGIMVPLNDREHLGDVAALAKLEAILTVGLRLGCINHALLTLSLCRELRIPVAGVVLVERWGANGSDIPRRRAIACCRESLPILGILPFAAAETESVEAGAKLFESLVKQER